MHMEKLRNYSFLYFPKSCKIQLISYVKIRFNFKNFVLKRIVLKTLKTFPNQKTKLWNKKYNHNLQ